MMQNLIFANSWSFFFFAADELSSMAFPTQTFIFMYGYEVNLVVDKWLLYVKFILLKKSLMLHVLSIVGYLRLLH